MMEPPKWYVEYVGWLIIIPVTVLIFGYKYVPLKCCQTPQLEESEAARYVPLDDLENGSATRPTDAIRNNRRCDTKQGHRINFDRLRTIVLPDLADLINSTIFMVYFEYFSGYPLFHSTVGLFQIFFFSIKVIFHLIDTIFVFEHLVLFNMRWDLEDLYVHYECRFQPVKHTFLNIKVIYKVMYSFSKLYQSGTFWSLTFSLALNAKNLLLSGVNEKSKTSKSKNMKWKERVLDFVHRNKYQILFIPLFIVMSTVLFGMLSINKFGAVPVVAGIMIFCPWITYWSCSSANSFEDDLTMTSYCRGCMIGCGSHCGPLSVFVTLIVLEIYGIVEYKKMTQYGVEGYFEIQYAFTLITLLLPVIALLGCVVLHWCGKL